MVLASQDSFSGVLNTAIINLILVVGIPLYGYMQMKANAANLNTVKIKEQLGFLYNGFRDRTYFWEIYIMYRKVLFVGV
jgi:hypothetical protein